MPPRKIDTYRYNRQVPLSGKCWVPRCRQYGVLLRNLNQHLKISHDIDRETNDKLPQNAKVMNMTNKVFCEIPTCREQKPMLKKNFGRHLRAKHSLSMAQYNEVTRKTKHLAPSINEKRREIKYMLCFTKPVKVLPDRDADGLPPRITGNYMPRLVNGIMICYQDGSIGCWAIGNTPKKFLFMMKETRFARLNFIFFETFYKAQGIVVEPIKNKEFQVYCIIDGYDYWPKILVSALHTCRDKDGACQLCSSLAIEWPQDFYILRK